MSVEGSIPSVSIERDIWDRGEDAEVSSYVKELLFHPLNGYGLLGALATGALLSIPFGIGIGALPLVAFATTDAIAALFVPGSGQFRAWVDRRKRRERREATRAHLVDEIRSRVADAHPNWSAYHRMLERLKSLGEAAKRRKTALSEVDLERLDDATVSYLGLWMALLLIEERKDTMDDRQLERSIKQLDAQIEAAKSSLERARFQQAREDLLRVKERREGLTSQEASVRAALLSMVDTFEEVHQQIVTAPTSGEAKEHLQGAVDRLRIEERLEVGIDQELADLFRARRAQAGATKATLR